MQLNHKQNLLLLSGNVSYVDIRIGQYGPFGHITIASDDGYRDVKNNNAWVERTQFIYCKISGKNTPVITVGDSIFIKGKVITEIADDNGAQKSIMKVEILEVLDHMPKPAIEVLKQANLHTRQLVAPKQGSSQGQPQRPAQQPAYNQAPQRPAYNQAPPQHGGYNQASPQGGHPNYEDDNFPHEGNWHNSSVPQNPQNQSRASRNPPPQR